MRFAHWLSVVSGALVLPVSVAAAASQDGNVEWDGVFSDTTANFVSPAEFESGDTITISLRTRAGDLTAASCRLYFTGPGQTQTVGMTRTTAGAVFDIWSVSLQVPSGSTQVWYRFSLTDGSDTDWYDAGDSSDAWGSRGMSDDARTNRDFLLVPGFATPDWSKEAVFYQIFPDRFYNGSSSNDRQYPDDCFWYLDYAPPCRDASCPDYATECAQYDVTVPAGYQKNCEIHEDWSESPNGSACDFSGGDLQGVTAKLDYVRGLNATTIYLNPVFRAPSNHKYDTMDFDTVDPRFGDTSALNALSSAAQSKSLRVITDGVFNHESDLGIRYNGWGNYAYDNGTDAATGYDFYGSTCGAWEETFLNAEAGNWTDCTSNWSDWFKSWVGTDVYDVDRDGDTSEPAGHTCGWYGFEFMPEIDYKSPSNPNSEARTWLYAGTSASSLSQARASIGGKWLADNAQLTVGLDGWRLDVPDNAGYFTNSNAGDCSKAQNDKTIWQGFRTAVKTVGADKYISGEIWGDASASGGVDWFSSLTYDGVMNYHYFGMPMSCYITGVGVHNEAGECTEAYAALSYGSATSVDALDAHLATGRRVYPSSATFSSQNLLSSHDTARFYSRAGGDVSKLKEAILFQATLPGAPMIYYGDEVAVAGANNEQGRATFPWDVLEDPNSQGSQLHDYTRNLLCVRRSYSALQTGSFVTLWTHNTDKTYGFGRFDDAGEVVVVINNSGSTRTIKPQVYRLDIADGTALVDVLTGYTYTVAAGIVSVSVEARGGAILVPEELASTGRQCLSPNQPPTADAGSDQTGCEGDTIVLDGSGSYDSDGDMLTYTWYDASGAEAGSGASLMLTGLTLGSYTYTLEVSDGRSTDTDTVLVTIEECCSGCNCPSLTRHAARYGLVLPVAFAGLVLRRRRRSLR